MESGVLQILVVLGVPGAALGVFYLLLKQFGFEFSRIGSTASAVIAILFLLLVGGITFFALHRWAPSKGNDLIHSETPCNKQSAQLIPCESGWCEPCPGSSGRIEFCSDFKGVFVGKIHVENLKPSHPYRLSIHGKKDHPGHDQLPQTHPNLIERFADIVDFSTNLEGNATTSFRSRLPTGYYSVDVRVKNNDEKEFKLVLYRSNIKFSVE